jgi:two-component system, OmpR family, response regulator VicR
LSNAGSAVIIEDREEMVETITLTLHIRWPDMHVFSSNMGRAGVELVKKEKPEVIILDLGLPDIDGYAVLRELRSFCNTPIIILTVRNEEEDIVKGLELGANDYIVKPFRQMELLSRVNVQLKKEFISPEESLFTLGSLALDLNTHVLQVAEKHINLTPIEARLMSAFMRNPGVILSNAILAKEAWEDYCQEAPYNLKVHIRHLREKIEIDPGNPEIILTKHHVGYYINKSQEIA